MLIVAKQCVLNQIQSYWLVSDAFNDVFSISVCNMQNEIQQSETTSSNFVRGDFQSKLQTFCMHMMGKVLVILAPFLNFSFTYNSSKA
jgi:hypothetical protein